MAGVMVQGPTPWWQLPEYNNSPVMNPANAPSGYEYDPVKMQYTRTPTSAGQRYSQFANAALGGIPSLAGLGGSAGAFGGSGTGTGTGGSGGPVGSGSPIPTVQAPDMTQSNNAIFAQAKDKVGQLSRASLDSLAGELGGQGMLGSGAQVQATRDVVNNNAGELGQVSRDLASKQADTANQFAQMGYQGAITQRGQDIQAQEANARLALEQRAQQYQLLQLILSGLGGAASASGGSGFLY
jgi:hypothetical protein